MAPDTQWFKDARYGLIIHYGLYSLLGRGEWVLNREQIPLDEYGKLADSFTAGKLNFDTLMRRAKNDWGMRYAVLTCKHHDGFCLYDSQLTDFTSTKTRCGRDLVGEFVEACRKHSMRIGLYHSLNDWNASPDAVDALEDPARHRKFIHYVHGQIREIMTNYGAIDIMWYDGWWPFGPEGWQARELNAMVRTLQPGILINSRCGLPGDFATPEGHITASAGMWEASMTLNDHWGYHTSDRDWKSPGSVVKMLQQVAAGAGNLLLNVGPKGDGSIPNESVKILDETGGWLAKNGEAIYGTDAFTFNLRERLPGDRAEWSHHGPFTAKGNAFYSHINHWPGTPLVIAGLECAVTRITRLDTGENYPFRQTGGKITVQVPPTMKSNLPIVIKLSTGNRPCMYLTGGLRTPKVAHCHYDPMPSDIKR